MLCQVYDGPIAASANRLRETFNFLNLHNPTWLQFSFFFNDF